MGDKIPSSQDVLNLFDLLEVIWNEKLTIAFTTLVAVGLGWLLIHSNEKQYQTSITFKIDVIPPYLEENEVTADVTQFFASPELFSKWEKNNQGSKFTFQMIDEKQIIGGNSFAVDEDGRFIVIGSRELVVKSNDIDLISDIADYLRFVSANLTQIYLEQAKQSQNKMDSGSGLPLNYGNALDANMYRAKISRFVFKVEQGLKILTLSRPSTPKRIAYRPKMTLALSVFLGITISSVFVLFRNSYRQHKSARLAKTRNEAA